MSEPAPSAWATALEALLVSGRADEARALLDGLQPPPAELVARRARAAAALARGDWPACVDQIRLNLEDEEESAVDWANLAAALGHAGRWAASRDAAIRAIVLDRSLAGPWRALLEAERALDLPAEPAVLVAALALHGQLPAVADAVAGRAERVDEPPSALAEALLACGHHPAVIALADRRPDLLEPGLQAAVLGGDRAATVRLARGLLDRNRAHGPALTALLDVAVEQGAFDRAVQLGVALLSHGPSPYALALLRFALAEIGDRDAEMLELLVAKSVAEAEVAALAPRLGCAAPLDDALRPGLELLAEALRHGRFTMTLSVTARLVEHRPAHQAALWAGLCALLADRGRPIEGLTAASLARAADPDVIDDALFRRLDALLVADGRGLLMTGESEA